MTAKIRRGAAPALLLALAVALPWLGLSNYVMNVAISFLVFAVLSAGLNLIYGGVGLLSFAQVAFWGIGGYTSALLAVDRGWNPWLGCLAGGATATLFALLIGYAALRLSRHAFAIVTLSAALLVQLVARDWVELTRGPAGLPGLPVPMLGTLPLDGPQAFYGVMLGFALLALALIHRVMGSRLGRTMTAIKENEPLALSQGIDTLRYKLLALGLSAALSGMAGGLYVFHLGIVDPTLLDFYYTETMLIMVIVGGPGSFWGVLGAALAFTALPELLRVAPDLRMVLYGAALILAMKLLPDGLGGYLRRRRVAAARAALS